MGSISQFISTKVKKGSLSLSVNAIVVLVLAIAMLGVGLAFTKSKFDEVQQVIVVEPPQNKGTSAQPIGLSSKDIKASQFQALAINVNYYNKYGDSFWVPMVQCGELRIQSDNWGEGEYEAVKVIPQYLKGGEDGNFQIVIPASHLKKQDFTAGDPAFTGQDVCEIVFTQCPTSGPNDRPVKATVQNAEEYRCVPSPDVESESEQITISLQ